MPKEIKTIQEANEHFNFDWNDYRTFATSRANLTSIETFLNTAIPTSENSRQRGELRYKLGTYYTHLASNPETALEHLNQAKKYLDPQKQQSQLAWTENHIAFANQQLFALSIKNQHINEAAQYQKRALQDCEKIITAHAMQQNTDSTKITAFAFCVRALVQYKNNQLNDAIKNYKFALSLYEKHDLTDDQYARAKNRMAAMLVENNQTREAEKAYAELEKYWSERKGSFHNIFCARFNMMHGDYLADSNKLESALTKYNHACRTLRLIEGKEASFTKEVSVKAETVAKKIAREDKAQSTSWNAYAWKAAVGLTSVIGLFGAYKLLTRENNSTNTPSMEFKR